MINNRLRLTTLDAIYSYDDRYYNFYKIFKESVLPPTGSSILLLGLGLGSIPFMLENKFNRRYHYTAVELDESVLYLFGKYQQERIRSPMEIVHTDAANFMEVQDECYDLICIDIFVGEVVPSHFKEGQFVRNIKNALAPGGRVLWNMLYASKEQIREVNEFLEFHFSAIFPDFDSREILGNVILTNCTY